MLEKHTRPSKRTGNCFQTGVKFCPKCRSTRIGVRYLDPFSLQPKYFCRSCGFSGFLVPEAVKTEKEEN